MIEMLQAANGIRPLEREFEAWIIRGIEDYFSVHGMKVDVIVVPTKVERDWPADAVFSAYDKVIGLQMKRPALDLQPATGAGDYPRWSDLHWTLSDQHQNRQFKAIKKCENIFYCLPTFLNRGWRRQALEHCLFWRPRDRSLTKPYYEQSPKARGANRLDRHVDAYRWGSFIERVMSCELGEANDALPKSAAEYFKDFLLDASGNAEPLELVDAAVAPTDGDVGDDGSTVAFLGFNGLKAKDDEK